MQDFSNRQVAFQRRRERRPIGAELPTVATTCICRNAHEPDADGFISTDPACRIHGHHRGAWAGVPAPRQPSPEELAAAAAAKARERQATQKRYKQSLKRR